MILFTHTPVFGVVAILLQMAGFVLMIKYYDKKPKFDEVKKSVDKWQIKHPDNLRYEGEIDLGIENPYPVPKSVAYCFQIKRKFPLFIVLFGLFLQIMPFIT